MGIRVALPHWLFLAAVVANTSTLLSPAHAQVEETAESPALRLFEERIMPIFRSPQPSSCVQCHLSSVDIKDYILPSSTETFLALRDQGFINTESPSESKILKLIRMGEKDLDKGARLIHEKTRKAELEAFSEWIKACCQDRALLDQSSPSSTSAEIGPDRPMEVVRHARRSRLVESFTRNVWSQRMRCFPCHTPHEIDSENPKHKVPSQRHADYVAKYGAKMNIFHATPEETLTRLVSGKHKPGKRGRYPMINLEDPAKSLLVLKPTAKLPPKKEDGTPGKPSSSDPVSHMGGLKMHVNDQSYKAFVTWIDDYASVVGDRYVTADDLPADNWVPTLRILRAKEIPESWGTGRTVQLFVHRKDTETNQWSPSPVAFTQGTITPRRFVNGALFLIRSNLDLPADSVSDDSFPLAEGEYLIKAFVDASDQISESPSLLLGSDDYVGKTVIDAKWQLGFPKAETFSALEITR